MPHIQISNQWDPAAHGAAAEIQEVMMGEEPHTPEKLDLEAALHLPEVRRADHPVARSHPARMLRVVNQGLARIGHSRMGHPNHESGT